MPAAKSYVVLHEFTTRVNDDTGEEKTFARGDTFDGPSERHEVLLDPQSFPDHGPMIAESTSDEAKAAKADARKAAKEDESSDNNPPAAPAVTQGA